MEKGRAALEKFSSVVSGTGFEMQTAFETFSFRLPLTSSHASEAQFDILVQAG